MEQSELKGGNCGKLVDQLQHVWTNHRSWNY